MLPKLSRSTALLLLPVLVQALVLPNELPEITSNSDPSRYNFESPSYGGPSTFFEYDIDEGHIKFAIPCPDCSDEEKELLKHEIISVKPTAQDTGRCTSTDPIGLEIDDRQVISTGKSNLALQSYIGPLHFVEHSKHHIFNRTRWINHCGCTKAHQDDDECDGDFQSSFSFEVLGLSSGQIPGFTVSYKQHGTPELLRFSTFPDIGIADSWRFGQSAHFQSPLLRLQKALIPTSTATRSSPSFLPSSTTSASLPSYTFLEEHPSITLESPLPSTTTPSVAQHFSISSDLHTQTSISDPAEHKHTQWCRFPEVLTALGHGIEAVAMKAKSGTQVILGKAEKIVPSGISPYKILPETIVSSDVNDIEPTHERIDDGIVFHDELDDAIVPEISELGQSELKSVEDFIYIPSPFLETNKAEKAFLLTSLMFIVVGLSGSLYALARRNPRLRARWAAVLEENRNQRLYRQAARKHRFLNFFSRGTSSCSEEKNVVSSEYIKNGEGLDWHGWEKRLGSDSTKHARQEEAYTIGRDLLAFQKAHQFVDSIISAEEGRPSAPRRFTYRTRHQRASSFGSERTAPPPYESDGEDLILDADGPRFVNTRRRLDMSPDSSVISTSPRSSCADSDSEHDEKF